MKVAITGSTGFVGSHTTKALIDAGHEVRLFARDRAKVGPALSPLGLSVEGLDVFEGDVTDEGAVKVALAGCDAVLHAASVYSLDPRRAKEIEATNVRGTELVLQTGAALGMDPILHISSLVALIGEQDATLTADSQPGNPPGAYMASKADSDRLARSLQAKGAPVVITYPGSTWGPHDPNWGETCLLAEAILRRQATISLKKASIPVTDVRDLAGLHARLMQAGLGPRRFIAPCVNMPLGELVGLIARMTGRRLPLLPGPAAPALVAGRLMDRLQRLVPMRLPITLGYEGAYIASRNATLDDSATRAEFGITPRDVEATFEDQLLWMAGTGRVPRRLIGRLGEGSDAACPDRVGRREPVVDKACQYAILRKGLRSPGNHPTH